MKKNNNAGAESQAPAAPVTKTSYTIERRKAGVPGWMMLPAKVLDEGYARAIAGHQRVVDAGAGEMNEFRLVRTEVTLVPLFAGSTLSGPKAGDELWPERSTAEAGRAQRGEGQEDLGARKLGRAPRGNKAQSTQSAHGKHPSNWKDGTRTAALQRAKLVRALMERLGTFTAHDLLALANKEGLELEKQRAWNLCHSQVTVGNLREAPMVNGQKAYRWVGGARAGTARSTPAHTLAAVKSEIQVPRDIDAGTDE